MTVPITIVIIDDHPVAIAGLAGRLGESGFAVAPSLTTVEELDATVVADVIICDLRLPGRSYANAITWLVEQGRCVLATSGVANREQVLNAVAAGARGYLSKSAQLDNFVRAVAALAGGSFFVSSELAGFLRTDADRRPLPQDEPGALDGAILRLFEQGERFEDIAVHLALSTAALTSHLAHIWDAARCRHEHYWPAPREYELIELAGEDMVLSGKALNHTYIAKEMNIKRASVPALLDRVKAKYLLAHPDAPEDITPLTAARRWAYELGLA